MRRISSILKPIIISLCLTVNTQILSAHDIPGSPSVLNHIDQSYAIDYCNASPLEHIEGIWRFTEDNLSVLICKNNVDNISDYIMIVTEADNASIMPGQIAGYIFTTSEHDKFRMYLYSDIANGTLRYPTECAATLSADRYSISFKTKSIRLKFNPFGFLPRFWRSIRLQISNPANELPKGFIKTFPSYDGNGSSLYSPRYL